MSQLFDRAYKVTLWIGGGLAALIAIPVVLGLLWMLFGIPHNRYVEGQVGEFCDAYRTGQPGDAAQMVRTATDRGFEVKSTAPSARDPVMHVAASRISWSGTTWRCDVTFAGGVTKAVSFRGGGFR